MNVHKSVFVAVVWVTSVPAFGQEISPESGSPANDVLRKRITAVVQPYVDDQWTRGMIVGVLKDGKPHFFGYGSISADNNASPDKETVFEIGSITKVFTALVLANMVENGEVGLSDAAQDYLADDTTVPTPGDNPITLQDLATHQSGMTNIPLNFWEPGDNRYDLNVCGKRWGGYSIEQLRDFFDNPAPPFDKSRKYVYSNVGMGTLGFVLERHAKIPLEQLIVDRICKPLGMKSTSFSLKTTGTGHDSDGVPVDNWSHGDSILSGAFALRSNCHDLLLFAAAHLAPAETPLAATIKMSVEPRGKISEIEKTGLGWRINKYGVIQSVGATGGFRAAIVIHPPTKTAVVTMVNTQLGGVVGGRAQIFDALAGILINVVLGAPAPDLGLPKLGTADVATYSDFVGHYRNAGGSKNPNFPIGLVEDKLMTTGPGKMELRLWPKDTTSFFLRSYNAEIKFERNGSGEVTGADFKFEGKQAKMLRSAK